MDIPIKDQDATARAFAGAISGYAPDRFAAQARRQPHAIAISSPAGEISYSALAAAAADFAARLAQRGLGDGALIAVCLPRSIALIASVLGAWQAGAAFLALDPAWPDNRLREIVADAGCAAMLCDEAAAGRGLVPLGTPVLLAGEDAGGASASGHAASVDRLAYVIYTSGSTGRPKGIEIGHANLASLVGWHEAAFALRPHDRVAHLAGLGFDAAIWEIWPALSVGATLVLAPEAVRTSAEALRDWLVAAAITVAFVPTVLAERMVALDWPPTGALRLMLTGGDRLHVFPPAGLPFALVNNYGPSECTVVATSGIVPAAPDRDGLPTIGRAILGTRIHLLDRAGQPVADGMPGEIVIAGAGVGRGYRGRPDLTVERFVPDPADPGATMFLTGDVGICQPDGEIAFAGRMDDQVQVRGLRVEPAEIAAIIVRHPDIAAATVASADDTLIGYVVLRDGVDLSAEDLRAFLADHLPEAMIPSIFLALDTLPMTANGKLDRGALPGPDAARRLAGAAMVLASTPVQHRLIEILTQVMPGRAIGIDDNFFMIGGHSLLGAQLVLKAGDAFGIELTLRELFETATVRRLAERIEDRIFEMVSAMSEEDVLLRSAG